MKLPQNILVIAAHPDDEVLMAAGIIRRAVMEKRRISVVVATNGDYLCADYSKGSARLQESLDVLTKLGMKEQDIYFLGYPDTGVDSEKSFLYRLMYTENEETVISGSAGCETYGISGGKQDFSYQRTGYHASYCRRCFEADLIAVLEITSPQLVITTSEWDQHADHVALARFVAGALKKRLNGSENEVELWQSLIHSPAGDDTWPEAGSCFTIPPNFEKSTGLKWEHRITVMVPESMYSPNPQDNGKRNSILEYKTAFSPSEPEVRKYLLSFAKQEEIFWRMDY